MFGLIFFVVLSIVVAYIAWRVVTRYRNATGTPWERLLATAKGSATVLWAYVVVAGGWIIDGASWVADLAQQPEISQWLRDTLPPGGVGAAFAVIAMVSIASRMRTLKD